MAKGKYHDDQCSHCKAPAVHFTYFADGEPTQYCNSAACEEKHRELMQQEQAELQELGYM